MGEWSFWQIPHVGVDEPDVDAYARTDTFTTIRRAADMKVSNFGSLWVGNRMGQGTDYTRTQLVFSSKDNLSNWKVITADEGMGHGTGLRGSTIDENPYIWGSTVKKFRDDQFFRMDMEHYSYRTGLEDFGSYSASTPHYVAKPMGDVMDTNVVHSGMNAYKNYPTEGWRSFGGKYDFVPYTGVLGRPRGNERE
jgi:hypothetical protein